MLMIATLLVSMPGSHDIEPNPTDLLFLDDSALNAAAGMQYGWKVAHLVEPDAKAPPEPVSQHQIGNIHELRSTFPELFKSS